MTAADGAVPEKAHGGTVRYLLMIYTDEAQAKDAPQSELDGQFAAHTEFGEKGQAAGVLKGGVGPLESPQTATTIRRTGAETDRLVTDGPFAETKEYMTGFYEVECDDLDTALDWAKQVPLLPGEAVEVRPVVDLSTIDPSAQS
jgi:hypothetical protein